MAVNAKLNVNISIHGRRVKDEPFAPWETVTHPLHIETDLESYELPLIELSQKAVDLATSMSQDGWQIDVNISVRLNNETHVPTAAGVIPLAKGHRDFSFTQLEVADSDFDLAYQINRVIGDLRTQAKY